MPSGVQDRLSLAAVYIRLLFEETCLATASAFLWRHEGKAFLISNWHNFAGRDPQTNKPLSDTAGIPDRVECVLYRDHFSNGRPVEAGRLLAGTYTFPLVDGHGQPLFLEHPLGGIFDVAAVPIAAIPEHVVPIYLNHEPFDGDESLYPGQEVFIIGYPLGLLTDTPYPIWKRGTIASEPYVLVEGMPKILIDTATRKGMSGAFVIVQRPEVMPPMPGDTNYFSGPSAITTRRILGIYSGRLGASNVEAQLGIVWRRELIDLVVAKAKLAEV